ncbi:hypothetical protein [Viridibacillus arvi]|uniref:hypothetical protein n=1 Tax=Viridibacillus arvi TaxID=263475 RepID=UPI003D089EE5
MKKKIYYVSLIMVFLYQISFLYMYLSEQLVQYNSLGATIYWITAGFFGILFGIFTPYKKNLGLFANIFSAIILLIGVGMVCLLVIAFMITSM